MILHVITGLSTGGAERALYNVLAGGLAKKGDVAVLSLGDEGAYGPRIRALGVPVYALGLRRGLPGPAAVIRLRQLVRALRPGLIQGWMYHGNLAARLAGRLAPGRPALAWNVRQSFYSLPAEKPLTRQVIRANRLLSYRVDALLYNSRLSQQQHEVFGFAPARGQVIPNGFDVEALRPSPDRRQAARRLLAIPEKALVVGHVARFHPIKDHAGFLRAAVRVAQQVPDALFMLAGREVGLQNPALAGILPPALAGRFHFLGERSDAQELMQAMDVLCTSSWGEAFPNVLGEAMASGVPCVATDVGDSRDIVADTGIIVPPSDSEALAQGVLRLLNLDTAERQSLGKAARRRIETKYSLPAIVARYAELYDALLVDRK